MEYENIESKPIISLHIPNQLQPVDCPTDDSLISCFIDEIKDQNNITSDCIISYGMQRSGTALLWNILKECFPDRIIIKTHRYFDYMDKCIVVGIYRDLREIILSRWRTMVLDTDVITKKMTINDYYPIKKVVEKEISVMETFYNLENSHFIKYEDAIIDDYKHIFDFIEKIFNIKIGYELRADINYNFSIETVQSIVDQYKMDSFKKFDKTTHFHAKHIAKTSGYKNYMRPELVKFIERKYKTHLVKYGYIEDNALKTYIDNNISSIQ